MVKNYQDYCREALIKYPKLYKSIINPDGSRKPPPKMAKFDKNKAFKEISKNELQKMAKDGWSPIVVKTEKSEIEITGTEIKIKGRKLKLNILELPKKINRKEYNRIWMHNSRVRQRIKELKEKYGDQIPL